jgi:hypothetical protein
MSWELNMADRNGQDTQSGDGGIKTPPEGLNWLLPLLGAIGFGIGFGVSCAIGNTTLDIVRNEYASVFPGTEVSPVYGLVRGLIAGGAGLGLAFADLRRVLNMALTGAAAFAAVLAFVLAVDISTVPEIMQNVIRGLLRLVGSSHYLYIDTQLGRGLVTGGLVGAVGGFALGLNMPQPTLKPSLWLGVAGGIWFAVAFAFEAVFFNGDVCSSWNGWGGAVGGAVLGFALALYNYRQAKQRRQRT